MESVPKGLLKVSLKVSMPLEVSQNQIMRSKILKSLRCGAIIRGLKIKIQRIERSVPSKERFVRSLEEASSQFEHTNTAQFSDLQSLEKGFPIHEQTQLNSEVCFIRPGIDQFIQRFVFFTFLHLFA